MKKSLLLTLVLIFAGSSVMAQNFRFHRPMSDHVPLNGGFLFGETNGSGVTQLGVQFVSDSDTVFAAHDGVVGAVDEEDADFAISITLDGMWGEDKINTFYAKVVENFVEEGDSISRGDPIAVSGTDADDPWFYFEVRHGWHSGETEIDGGRLNPEGWFAMDTTGIIVGAVPTSDNGVRVDISPDPKPRPPYESYGWSLTYDFDEPLIGADPIYNENYIIGDVVPGTYTITSGDDYEVEVTVEAGEIVHADGGPTSVEEPMDLAKDIRLNQNYPNPFNPSTVISFSIPENSHVNLAVYDITGKQVAELANSRMAAGNHEVNFNASNLSSGIYFYRLTADNQVFTRKLTLIK